MVLQALEWQGIIYDIYHSGPHSHDILFWDGLNTIQVTNVIGRDGPSLFDGKIVFSQTFSRPQTGINIEAWDWPEARIILGWIKYNCATPMVLAVILLLSGVTI